MKNERLHLERSSVENEGRRRRRRRGSFHLRCLETGPLAEELVIVMAATRGSQIQMTKRSGAFVIIIKK